MLSAILGLGKSLIGGFATDWTQKRQHKRDLEAAVTQNKIKLAESDQSHNQAWELAQLEGKDSLLRRLSFILMSAPFIVAMFSPQAVKEYFEVALSTVPDWYQWAYVSMLGAIWGISEFKKWKS